MVNETGICTGGNLKNNASWKTHGVGPFVQSRDRNKSQPLTQHRGHPGKQDLKIPYPGQSRVSEDIPVATVTLSSQVASWAPMSAGKTLRSQPRLRTVRGAGGAATNCLLLSVICVFTAWFLFKLGAGWLFTVTVTMCPWVLLHPGKLWLGRSLPCM